MAARRARGDMTRGEESIMGNFIRRLAALASVYAALALFHAAPALAQRPTIPAQAIRGPELRIAVAKADWIDWPAAIEAGQIAAVAIGKRDHLFVLNRGPQALLEFDADGKFVRSFAEGLFERAHSVTIDARGNFWVTDVTANVVLELDPQGKVLRTLGTRGESGDWDEAAGLRRFAEPTDVAFGTDGSIFVTQGHSRADPKVLKFDADGRFLKEWGGRGTQPWEFAVAHSIAIDAAGLVYVADRENRRIVVFDQEGELVKGWVYRGMACSLTLGEDGLIYMTTGFDGQIVALDMNGRVLGVTGRPGAAPNEYGEAHDIAVARDGTIFVADVVNRRVEKLARVR
jgi:DNA-binding beta-propeller fold protein YncE